MPVNILVAAGRARALSIMVDSATITRSATTFTNQDTGARTQSVTTIYTGRCRIQQQMPGSASASEPGEAHLLMLQLSVQLPMSVQGVQPGDIVTITASQMDPELVGRTFRVNALSHKTHGTSRRLAVQEVT